MQNVGIGLLTSVFDDFFGHFQETMNQKLAAMKMNLIAICQEEGRLEYNISTLFLCAHLEAFEWRIKQMRNAVLYILHLSAK